MMHKYTSGERDLFSEMILYFYTLPENTIKCPKLNRIFGKEGVIHRYLVAKRPVDRNKHAVISSEHDMYSLYHQRLSLTETAFCENTFCRNKVTGRLQYVFKDPNDRFIFGFELPTDGNTNVILHWDLISKDRDCEQRFVNRIEPNNIILNIAALSEAHKVLLAYKLSQLK